MQPCFALFNYITCGEIWADVEVRPPQALTHGKQARRTARFWTAATDSEESPLSIPHHYLLPNPVATP